MGRVRAGLVVMAVAGAWVMVGELGACTASKAEQVEEPGREDIGKVQAVATASSPDVHSFARPDEVRVKHVKLDLEVSFETKTLVGQVELMLERAQGADLLVVDARGLLIREISDQERVPLNFMLGPVDRLLGQAVQIELLANTTSVVVEYATVPEAAALQWLPPELTASKVHPFLFTQGQAILTRTWIPLQDSPGVRITYDARVKVPLGLQAVMSAERQDPSASARTFSFAMEQPIPPYLIALAVGDLAFRKLGPRTGVWAEPSVVEAAATEFEDVEAMMTSVERLYGPYRWGRYDVLVLPPSFPFGGMENPRLTFLSPTVIAGDKSLVSVLAHELAHSWSGNLVTNATWADFWLNEGFTTYIENRVLEEIYGLERAKLVEALGRRDFLAEVSELGADHVGTALQQSLDGKDPDEAITSTPYDKGMAFLRLLETKIGRERFDRFLREYFDDNAFGTMTTSRFEQRLREQFLAHDPDLEASLHLSAWLYQPGLPPNLPPVESQSLKDIEEAAGAFAQGKALPSAEGWGSLHWVLFLRALPRSLSTEQVRQLDERLHASSTGNSEIRFEWLKLVVANRYEAGFVSLEEFLTRQGRRRLVRPLYEALVKSPWGKELARSIYAKARVGYHPLTVDTLERVLEGAGS